jgi:hypothetical protein
VSAPDRCQVQAKEKAESMNWVVEKWRSLRKGGGSWRGLSQDDFWNMADCVIATTTQGRGGRGNSFECWTFGQLISVGGSLQEAKDVVEQVYGPLHWETVKLPPITVTHVTLGETDEFGDPRTLHVVRKLPRLI